MNLNLPFTVSYAATCDGNCDCIDSCPIGYETAELNALDILAIGVHNDHEWVERIIQGHKVYTHQEVIEALVRTVIFQTAGHVKQGLELPELTKDMLNKLNKKVNK